MTRRNAQLHRTRAWPAMASHDAHLAMPPASVPPPLPQGLSVRERPPPGQDISRTGACFPQKWTSSYQSVFTPRSPGDMHTCCTVHSANRLDRVLGIALLVIQHACRTEKMKRPGPGTIVTVCKSSCLETINRHTCRFSNYRLAMLVQPKRKHACPLFAKT